MAEIVLPAGVQAQVLAHSGSLCFQEPHQTTDMIVMTMADDQRVHLCDVDLQNLEVVHIDVRREAEVEQVAACFRALAGLDVQSQPPFAFQRLALPCLGKSEAADRETGRLRATEEDVVRVVGDLADNDLVDHRHVDPHGGGSGRPIERNAACQQRATKHSRASQEATAVERILHVRSLPYFHQF